MSEQVLEKAWKAYLDAQKNKQPKIYRRKQSLRHLAQQNAGLANIEISDKNIKGEKVPCGLCSEKGYHRRKAPVPGFLQEPGCQCNRDGVPGIYH